MQGLWEALAEHLDELRRRLLRVAILLVVTTFAGLALAGPFVRYLITEGPAKGLPLNSFSPWDGLRIYMKVAFVVGLAFTLPSAMLELWRFVKPGLTRDEARAALRHVPISFILMLGGVAFGYYVICPLAFQFTMAANNSIGLVQTYGALQYVDFLFQIVIPIAILSQLPILCLFLTSVRVLSPTVLKRWRKVAYFLLLVISTIITPPDFVTPLLVSVPLVALYELGIMLSSAAYERRKQSKP